MYVYVLRDSLGVLLLPQLSNVYCVCLELSSGDESLYVSSLYCKYGDPICPYLVMLREISDRFRGRALLVGTDVNARSRLWHCSVRNARGASVEDCIAECGLVLLNEWSPLTTYESGCGVSNIDLTLVSGECFALGCVWSLVDERPCDHRLLLTRVGWPVVPVPALPRPGRLCTRRADWPAFDQCLAGMIGGVFGVADSVDDKAVGLSVRLMQVARECIPAVSISDRFNEWWSARLAVLRGAMRRARRRYQWSRVKRDEFRRAYLVARSVYYREVRVSKFQAWKRFVMDESERDPWGVVYKCVVKGRTANAVFCSLGVGMNATLSVRETLELVLRELLPVDDVRMDDVLHRRVRGLVESVDGCGENVDAWCEGEVTAAVMKFANRKAPGLDGVTAEIVKRAWPRLCAGVTSLMNQCLEEGNFP